MCWLMIETCCFYLYMLAAIVFILVRQLQSAWCDALETADMKKALTDYVQYSMLNLTWFAINFVTCAMPPVCIWLNSDEALDRAGYDQSFQPVIYTLWAMHLIAFLAQVFIYDTVEKKEEDEVSRPNLQTSFDKDDGFKLQAAINGEGEEEKKEEEVPSHQLKTISFEQHYVKMDRQFIIKPWKIWIWIVNMLVTLGCLVAFFIMDGKELVYALYIPLDVGLNLAKAAFYFFYFFQDKRIKEDRRLLEEAIEKKSQTIPTDISEPLIGQVDQSEASADAEFIRSKTEQLELQKTLKEVKKS
mmetsp:Transcript_6940/g.9635  ORF Transcript_6940/g.9635 Transcript_6940/m.9635 type:complete len:301 (+) Transcript_6940:496-1398(+)